MTRDHEPMPPALGDEQLDLLRRFNPGAQLTLPDGAAQRVFFRVSGSLAAADAGGDDGSGPSSTAVPLTDGGASAVQGALATHKALVIGALSFALGVGVGAAVTRALSPNAVVPAPVVAPSLSTPAGSSAPVTASASASVSAQPSTSSSVRTAPSSASSTRDSQMDLDRQLAEERALLDMARAALSRQDPSNALAALQRHFQRFPQGRLREEREALMVQALRASGRDDEADSRSKKFRKDFPESLQQP